MRNNARISVLVLIAALAGFGGAAIGIPVGPGTTLRLPNATDDDLAALEGNQDLLVLILSNSHVTDVGLAHLKDMKNLQTLNLMKTQVTDAGLAYLKDMISLQTLNLMSTPVTDAGLAQLKGMKSLKRIVLTGTKVTDAGLADLRASLPGAQIVPTTIVQTKLKSQSPAASSEPVVETTSGLMKATGAESASLSPWARYEVTKLAFQPVGYGFRCVVDGDRIYCATCDAESERGGMIVHPNKPIVHFAAYHLPDGIPLGPTASVHLAPAADREPFAALASAGDRVYIATQWGLFEYGLDGKVRVIGEADGLTETKISSLACYDGKLYMGLGAAFVRGRTGFACYDLAAKKSTLLACSIAKEKHSALDGGFYHIGAILADPKRKCLWLSVSVGPGNGSDLTGIWRYDPANGKLENAAPENRDCNSMAWCGGNIVYDSFNRLILLNPDTMSKTWIFSNDYGKHVYGPASPLGVTGEPVIQGADPRVNLGVPFSLYDGECLVDVDLRSRSLTLRGPAIAPTLYSTKSVRFESVYATPFGILVVGQDPWLFTKKEAGPRAQ